MTLKRSRQLVAILFVMVFGIAFLGINLLPEKIYGALAHFQLVPAVVGLISGAGLIFIVTFLLIFLLTLIFGRIYCSYLCPMGIFQDFLARLFYRKKKSAKIPVNTQPVFFYLTLITAAFGSLWLINLLDPYSLFGKLVSTLFRPLFYRVNNLLVSGLQQFDIYAVPILKHAPISLSIILFTGTVLLVLLIGSFFQRRIFCRKFCPAGYALSLFSGNSLFSIDIDDNKCTNCSLCSQVCKMDCIDFKNNEVTNKDCVKCFNCLDVCPVNAIQLTRKKPKKAFTPSKRNMIKSSGALATFLLPLPFRASTKQKLLKFDSPVMPPGAGNLQKFTDHCTACQLCVTKCPTDVMTAATGEYGLSGLFQPYMNFNHAYCEYDCNICSSICPTDALDKIALETKQLTQLGTVELKTDLCVVYKNNTDCGACAEGCPTHAVYTEMENNISYPKTRTDICIGCGACQYMCPVDPKAIVVRPNQKQIIAEKPFEESAEDQQQMDKSDEEFPF